LRNDLEGNKFFNINLPENPARAKVVLSDRLQKERYATKVTKRVDPDGRAYYWIGGGRRKEEKGTDAYELMKNNRIVISEMTLAVLGVRR
jgi:5'-nucleotidase